MIPGQARSGPQVRSILIVEDDSDLREALGEVLRDEGYTVEMAADGREALDRLRRQSRPSLILLDLTMPVMNGWQFRAEQRQDPGLSGTRRGPLGRRPSGRADGPTRNHRLCPQADRAQPSAEDDRTVLLVMSRQSAVGSRQ